MMMTNVMVKTWLSKPRNNKYFVFNLGKILRVTHIRDRKLTEGRIDPKAECHRMFRSVDWTHDMISWSDTYSFDTSANLALWQIRHRLNPHERVNDYQRYSMLIVLPLRSMSWTLHNLSSFYAGGDDQFSRYFFPLSAKKDNLKNFSGMWWWQMLWWKHDCLNQEIINISYLI